MRLFDEDAGGRGAMSDPLRARLTALVAEMRKDAAAHDAEAVLRDRHATGRQSAARERVLAQVHRYWADQLAALRREPPERVPSCPTSLPLARTVGPAEVAAKFHETYERLAPSFGYQTRPETRTDWGDLPDGNKQLMMAVATEVLRYIGERAAEARP
jgi:hypothetical protein